MTLPIFQVDAFTSEPMTGNPAAVCPLGERALDDATQQKIALEMNLSETAFLEPLDDGTFGLRWFTPTHEVDLCGHATLASAHVLWREGHVAPHETIRFDTRSGRLAASPGGDGWIVMDFPAEPVSDTPTPPGLADALGVEPLLVQRNRMDVLVEVADEAAVRALDPDLQALNQIDTRGVIVTAPAADSDASGYDFVSRLFAPQVGIPEDPVTGSAHCALGPFWAERLGATKLVGRQVSARGGTVQVEVNGDRVLLGGQAVTTLQGTLHV